MTDFKIGSIVFGPAYKDFEKFFVGVDDHAKHLNTLYDQGAKNTAQHYPPYNIRKTGANSYVIDIAVAGFTESNIDITIDDGKLIVRGDAVPEKESKEDTFLFRGIASRAFTRTFVIDEHIEVDSAELNNGMLTITLERRVPEESQLKKIKVNTKPKKQLLQEES